MINSNYYYINHIILRFVQFNTTTILEQNIITYRNEKSPDKLNLLIVANVNTPYAKFTEITYFYLNVGINQ